MRIISVKENWTWTHEAIGSNPCQVIIVFNAAGVLLFHIIQRITEPKFCICRKSMTIFHVIALF
jgi:hypothetical protein